MMQSLRLYHKQIRNLEEPQAVFILHITGTILFCFPLTPHWGKEGRIQGTGCRKSVSVYSHITKYSNLKVLMFLWFAFTLQYLIT